MVIVLGAVLPNMALAASRSPAAKEACESQARVSFQKKAVALEMEKILGNLSELEVVSEREGLEKRLEKEKASCGRLVARSSAAAGSEAL